MLSDKQLRNVCLSGCGSAACRYLEYIPKSGKQMCLRQLPARKKDADKRVQKIKDDCKKQGVDPMTTWQPLGDGNGCAGFLPLAKVLQGYDIKP